MLLVLFCSMPSCWLRVHITPCHHLPIISSCGLFLGTVSHWFPERNCRKTLVVFFFFWTKNFILASPRFFSNLKSFNLFALGYPNYKIGIKCLYLCFPPHWDFKSQKRSCLFPKMGLITIGEPFVGKKRTPSHSVCTPNKVQLDQHLNVYNKTVNYQKIRLFL